MRRRREDNFFERRSNFAGIAGNSAEWIAFARAVGFARIHASGFTNADAGIDHHRRRADPQRLASVQRNLHQHGSGRVRNGAGSGFALDQRRIAKI